MITEEIISKILLREYSGTGIAKRLKESEEILTNLFDVSLTLSEKMFLKQEVQLSCEERLKNLDRIHSPESLSKNCAARFILTRYTMGESEVVANVIIYNKPSTALNLKIMEARKRYE